MEEMAKSIAGDVISDLSLGGGGKTGGGKAGGKAGGISAHKVSGGAGAGAIRFYPAKMKESELRFGRPGVLKSAALARSHYAARMGVAQTQGERDAVKREADAVNATFPKKSYK